MLQEDSAWDTAGALSSLTAGSGVQHHIGVSVKHGWEVPAYWQPSLVVEGHPRDVDYVLRNGAEVVDLNAVAKQISEGQP